MRFSSVRIIALLLLLCSCSVPYRSVDGFAQGTTYHIVYQAPTDVDLADTAAVFLQQFDRSLSIYDSLSLLSQVNRGEDPLLDVWFVRCFEASCEVYRQTDGLFDPTLSPLIRAWGFSGGKANHSLEPAQRDSLLLLVGMDKVQIVDNRVVMADPRMKLNFDAIAQGLSVDLLSEKFDALGIKNYLIEIGGEVFARGKNAKGQQWRVGIDRPTEGNNTPGADLQTIMLLEQQGLATSGNYRKFFITDQGDKITHTIDPRTGEPAQSNLLSATIVAPSATLADGYGTACMVGGLEWSKRFIAKHPELGACLIYSEGDQLKELKI